MQSEDFQLHLSPSNKQKMCRRVSVAFEGYVTIDWVPQGKEIMFYKKSVTSCRPLNVSLDAGKDEHDL